tara:strand:- start:793 stop:1029 length:237 start_codon:yes stop_codon:yes gene_type:complete
MKNLKIRFIKEGSTYLLQKKKYFRWRWAMIQDGSGMMGPCYVRSYGDSKLKSLNKYLHEIGKCKQYVKITEYPTIKKY